jgi:hypothetical protein
VLGIQGLSETRIDRILEGLLNCIPWTRHLLVSGAAPRHENGRFQRWRVQRQWRGLPHLLQALSKVVSANRHLSFALLPQFEYQGTARRRVVRLVAIEQPVNS